MSRKDWEEKRKPVNDATAETAEHHHEPWGQDELRFLDTEWNQVPVCERDEVLVAEILGRSVEACRIQAHYLRTGKRNPDDQVKPRQKRVQTSERVTTIHLPGGSITTRDTVATSDYIGFYDDPEDVWWK
jgi:hypothetical protein